jgi:S-adenosylmethionine decarboxylase
MSEPTLPPFEGPEKTLEIDFVPTIGHESGLRALPLSAWEDIVSHAKAQILNHEKNEDFDSYLLSESSLFVYKHKVLLKTCGTTTLLGCVPPLVEHTKKFNLQFEWIGYTRKNLSFPQYQIYPHQNFNQEVNYLKETCNFDGEAYVLGPLSGDHWFIYVWDDCDRPMVESQDRTLNIMMYDLDVEATKIFWKNKNNEDNNDVNCKIEGKRYISQLWELLPGAKVHDYLFDPCGYSLNGLLNDAYVTIHVTPEDSFSYASFETNVRTESYLSLVKSVIAFFKPNRFSMTFFVDEGALLAKTAIPTDLTSIEIGTNKKETWSRTTKCQTSFAADYHCMMANYVCQEDATNKTIAGSHNIKNEKKQEI